MSSILAFLVSFPWANKILFDDLFMKNPMTNIRTVLSELIVMLVAAAMSYYCCSFVTDSLIGMVIKGMLAAIISSIVFLLCFSRTEEFKYWINQVEVHFHIFIRR